MAEQTFRSPGFFEQEIDATEVKQSPLGVPAGIIGTAEKGPAFVPVTIGSFNDFVNRFGGLDTNRFGPYAVNEFLKNRSAVTYMRVLGAGANSASDITTTETLGTVVNAGFKVLPQTSTAGQPAGDRGPVYMLCAKHYLSSANDLAGYPVFFDNPSFASTGASAGDHINLVRGVLFSTVQSRVQVMNQGEAYSDSLDSFATVDTTDGKYFVIAVSSSQGTDFSNQNPSYPGVKFITASLDPSDSVFVGDVLNTDATKFYKEQHYLYLNFAVEDQLATVSQDTNAVAMLSGSANTANSSDTATNRKFSNCFGRYDTRFTTPRSPDILSQPYGGTEYPLFHFEALSDGAYSNHKLKLSFANLRASTDPNYDYPTFDVQIRNFGDTDQNPEVMESFPACNLDPNSENFVARKIGDYKAYYNFDADDDDERRIVVSGKYPAQSLYVRIRMSSMFDRGEVPASAMPFGFSGLPVFKTTDSLTDVLTTALTVDGVTIGNAQVLGAGASGNQRVTGSHPTTAVSNPGGDFPQSGSIVPPLPLRFKVTRGDVDSTPRFTGEHGTGERVDGRLYWGLKYERMPKTGQVTNPALNANASALPNPLIKAYTTFNGISKLDTLVTGSGLDNFNANKFTLARVAVAGAGATIANLFQYITGSAKEHMLDSAYYRESIPDSQTYVINDGTGDMVTLASLVNSSSIKFNRFTSYAKFNAPFYGGFDGVNILDKDMYYMNDLATSTDSSANGFTGKASSEFLASSIGLSANPAGTGKNNNNIFSYKEAARIMTDPMTVRTNILAIPGIRDAFVADDAAQKVKDYSQAIYLMDIPAWSEGQVRLFGGENRNSIASASYAIPDVRETSEQFEGRTIDNNYTATYFPDVYIRDEANSTNVRVPASVAAIAAIGFNDRVSYPWFAPAGFNRGALDSVTNVDVRLTSGDRDTLYDARINPIATFPAGGFVIFGQKTLQLAKSALDRVNVRRMLLEVKRQVSKVAKRILFEPNTAVTRAKFVNLITPMLAVVQAQQGIEQFKIICDDTNNSEADVINNRLNGRIVVVPTRAIEFISIDFIVTNSGVSFE